METVVEMRQSRTGRTPARQDEDGEEDENDPVQCEQRCNGEILQSLIPNSCI